MVVVVLITGAAAAALAMYKHAAALPASEFEERIFSVKQQAGVVAALAGVVFAILAALQHGKNGVTSAWGSTIQPRVSWRDRLSGEQAAA